MKGQDFIPRADGEFDDFFRHFHDAVTGHPDDFGLSDSDVTLIRTKYAAWVVGYAAHQDAQKRAHEAATTKDKSRDEGEGATRSVVKKINGNPAVDNEMRAKARLPSHGVVRTPIGVPASRPVLRLEPRSHNTLVVHFVDENTPQQNAKPHGVHACEICVYIGDAPPADGDDFTFLAHDTRTPYADAHLAADAGKTAHYIGRWLNSKLEPGPWSHVVSMKIPL